MSTLNESLMLEINKADFNRYLEKTLWAFLGRVCSIGGSEGLDVAELGVVAEEARGPAGPVLQRLPDGQRANEKTQKILLVTWEYIQLVKHISY